MIGSEYMYEGQTVSQRKRGLSVLKKKITAGWFQSEG